MNDLTKNIRVDDDLDEYKGFYDYRWSKEFLETVKPTKLRSVGFDLLASWKGTSETRRFPWLMINAVDAAVEGSLQFTTPFSSQILNELAHRITTGLERKHLSLSGDDRESLCTEIRSIESEISHRVKTNPVRLDPKELWTHFLQRQGISLSLLMSEVNAYAAVYFAYEIYLIRSVKVCTAVKSIRTRGLPKRLNELLGEKVAETCWSAKKIDLARLIRHSIVHNGRKLTDNLEKYRSELTLENDEIVIMAHHTTELYTLLKERALLFTTEMVKLPICRF